MDLQDKAKHHAMKIEKSSLLSEF